MHPHELDSKHFDKALKLLKDRHRDITLADISKATNIKESWLRAFSKGSIYNPGVRQIDTLIAYFEG